jgi:hypothetical protein
MPRTAVSSEADDVHSSTWLDEVDDHQADDERIELTISK